MNTKRAFLIFWILTSASMYGEILDRMMAVVNNHIVTLSDMKRERTIRAVLGERVPHEDKALLQDLIDAQIIDEQVLDFPGIDVVDADVQGRMNKISNLQGIPAAIMRSAIQRRLRMSEFFDLRFRQFLNASDDEIRKYYETVFVPEAQKRGMTTIPALDVVTTQIRSNIIEEKLTPVIDDWLATLRKRSTVEVFE